MSYTVSAYSKLWFLVTPPELESILSGFHLVVENTGVERDYTESSLAEYIRSYENLYRFLCSGQKAEWETNYDLFRLETGITAHLDHITYRPASRLSVPDFEEPCVTMGAFCVIPFGNSPLTKGWALHQFPENTMGLVIRFPSRVRFNEGKGEKLAKELDDHETWTELKKRIRKLTAPLKIIGNGRAYDPHIRVSEQAKKDLQGFYVKRSLDFEIL